MPFSNEEKRDMLQIYYASHRNAQITSETYLQRYPEREQPAQNYFLLLHRNLADYGSFIKPRRRYNRRDNVNEMAVLQAVSELKKNT